MGGGKNRFRFYLMVLFLSVVLFILSFLQYEGFLQKIDLWAYNRLPYTRSSLVLVFSLSGSVGVLAFMILLLIYDVMVHGALRKTTVAFLFSLAITMILVWLLKAFFRSPRPLGSPDSYSFLRALRNPDLFSYPSGHAARASVVAYFYGRRRYSSVIAWSWVTGVCASRLLLHAHWLGDVASSIVLGVLVSFIVESTSFYWARVYNNIIRNHKRLRIETA